MDIEYLKSWIGRSNCADDMITDSLADRFHKTLALQPRTSTTSLAGIHWCLAPPAVFMDEVGADGHPEKGGFLPPVPLPYRMWASGDIDFIKPLAANTTIQRQSEIIDIKHKTGTSGPLVFVDVEHRYSSAGKLHLREVQTLVYKSTSGAGTPQKPEEIEGVHEHICRPDPVLLFRYSALTFNGHRIHYDHLYATKTEGYPGLVVHGPLITTLLMHLASQHMADHQLSKFRFKGISPAFSGDQLRLIALPGTSTLSLQARGEDGRLIMKAEAYFNKEE